MNPWLETFGRLHPMLLHAPIGLLIGLVILELIALVRRRSLPRSGAGILVYATAVAAALAAGAGWVLHEEGGYDETLVERHEWLGIALAVLLILMALAYTVRWTRGYRILLFASLIVFVPAGHYGAAMTHGSDFVMAPLRRARGATPGGDSTASGASADANFDTTASAEHAGEFARSVHPLLLDRCSRCHGAERQKGGLSMLDAEALFSGGNSGSPIVAGDAAASELVRRMRLPLEHDEHMPPDGKPQLESEEIDTIEYWISAGAVVGAPGSAPATAEEQEGSEAALPTPEDTGSAQLLMPGAESRGLDTVGAKPGDGEATQPPDEALAALRARLLHVEPLGRDSDGLWIDAAAATDVADEELAALLEPLKDNVLELGLARTSVGASTLAVIGRMPRLERLDLRATGIESPALEGLRGHAVLRELVLAQNSIDARCLVVLETLPALERVYLWATQVTPDELTQFEELRPAVRVLSS